MTNKQFQQKAKFVDLKVELLGPTNSKKISIKYTRPDTETPDKTLEVGAFESKLSTETKTYLKQLQAGTVGPDCCVTKEQNGNFWTLVGVSDISNAPEREAKPAYNKGGYSGGGGGGFKANPAGQTIGMAIKAGVDWALANKADFAMVGKVARDIMALSATMETEYNAGNFKSGGSSTTNPNVGSTTSSTATKSTTSAANANTAVAEVDLSNLNF